MTDFNIESKKAWRKKNEQLYQEALADARARRLMPAAVAVVAPLVAALILMALFMVRSCHASDISKGRFVNAIIGEAEGEPYRGKLAVACAIRNRGTLKGVYGERAPRVIKHKYSPKVFVDAVRAYEESANPEKCTFVDQATHWEGTGFKEPYWAGSMKVVAVVGKQRFYREYYESEEQEMIDRRHGL